jgi:hypothetical protein
MEVLSSGAAPTGPGPNIPNRRISVAEAAMARSIHASIVVILGFTLAVAIASRPSAWAQTAPPLPAHPLTCGSPPCILPNVQVSQSPFDMSTQAIVSNPSDPTQLVIADLDWTCATTYVATYSSVDSGTNWTHTCLPSQPGLVGGGTPLIGYGLNNVLYAGNGNFDPNNHNKFRLITSASQDNGLTWSTPTSVIDRSVGQWLAVDTSPSSHVSGILYSTSLEFSLRSLYVVVSHSRDGGQTWATDRLDRASSEHAMSIGTGGLAVARDGTVYVTWTHCKLTVSEGGCRTGRIYFARSTDGGKTWSVPLEIAHPRYGHLTGGGEIIFPTYTPWIATDNSTGPYSGNIYLSFPSFKPPNLVGVMTSHDGGRTWNHPVPVSSHNVADQFMNFISVAQDGTVGVTWLDRRRDRDHYQPYYAISKDGGATFTGDQPLSDVLSDPQIVYDFGAFRTHTWAGNTLYATWTDTRTGIGQIFFGGVQF